MMVFKVFKVQRQVEIKQYLRNPVPVRTLKTDTETNRLAYSFNKKSCVFTNFFNIAISQINSNIIHLT